MGAESLLSRLPPETIQRYLARRESDLATLDEALRTGELARLIAIGHTLKGNGTTFGFPELSVLGAELEKAAHGKDLATAERLVRKFSEWLSAKRLPPAASPAPDAKPRSA